MLLELKEISINYFPDQNILERIDLNIEKGEFVGIVGKAGCGKTTLLESIGGLKKPQSGYIYFNGEDIYQNNFNKLNFRKNLQIVFQFPENLFFEQDVFSETSYGLRMHNLPSYVIESRVKQSLESVGFDFESIRSKSPFSLSGGQKRRLALACALAIEPKILLLDEPFSGLDAEGSKLVADILINEHQKGTTIVLVSHDPNILCEICDRIIVLSDRKIALDGNPVQVYSKNKDLQKIGIVQPYTQILTQLLGMEQLNDLKYEYFIQRLIKFIQEQA